ncbi:MAG: hypothetical protein R3A80_02635 [Bdellovibrionota bacterium]
MLSKILSTIGICCVFVITSLSLAAPYSSTPKFEVRGGKIAITPAGYTFIENVVKQQVTGKIRKVKKKEAYEWAEKFIKLSNRKAVESADFTPINNLFNHLILCDDLFSSIYAPDENNSAPLAKSDEIPEKRKEKLLAELKNLRKKIEEDSEVLVSSASLDDFNLIINFYDKALKETLDI